MSSATAEVVKVMTDETSSLTALLVPMVALDDDNDEATPAPIEEGTWSITFPVNCPPIVLVVAQVAND